VITNEPPSFSPPALDNELDFSDPAPSEQQLRIIDPDNPPWGIPKALLTWALSIAFLIVVPLVVIVPYVVYLSLHSRILQPEALSADKTVLFLSILGAIPAHILTVAVAWAIVTSWGRYPFWETVGFSWPKSFGPWTNAAFCGAVAVVLLGIGLLITSIVGGGKTQLDQLIESSYQARVATAFLAVATAPFVEELIHRGILYPALQRTLGVPAAVAIVSIMFAGVHVVQYKNNLGVIAVISVLSVTLTVVRAVTGKLLPSFMIHLVFNGIQSVFLLIEPFFEKADKVMPSKVPALEFIQSALHHLL
jgi:membrane protease YdiL (CAAX protease family)